MEAVDEQPFKVSKYGGVTMATRTRRDLSKKIAQLITPTTKSPTQKFHELRYPDHNLWKLSIDRELDKLEANGNINWLDPAHFGLLQIIMKAIPATLQFAYKRNVDSIRRQHRGMKIDFTNTGKPKAKSIHFYPECTRALMVYRCASPMVVLHRVENRWKLEHFDIHNALLYENYGYHKSLHIKQIGWSNGKYKHGGTAGILLRASTAAPGTIITL